MITCRLICVFAGRIEQDKTNKMTCLINVPTLFSACLSGYRRLDNNAVPHPLEVFEDDECVLDDGYTSDISTCFQNCSSIGSCTGFVSFGYTYGSENYFFCTLLSCTNLTYYMYLDYVPGARYYSYFKDENCAVGESYQIYIYLYIIGVQKISTSS